MRKMFRAQVWHGSRGVVTGLLTRSRSKGIWTLECEVRHLGALMAFTLLFLTACAAAPASEPLLGRTWAPNQEGYGKPHPKTIFNGGDPTGLVTDVRWRSWGKPKAVGEGIGLYAPGIGADGHRTLARVVAFNLGMCHGVLAYRDIEWFFPQHGESFDPHAYINICTGNYVG